MLKKRTWPSPAFRLKSLLIHPQGWLKIYMTHPLYAKGATNVKPWPNGQASFLISTRKLQKTHFKADMSCISLVNNRLMSVTQLASTWVGWPNGEKLGAYLFVEGRGSRVPCRGSRVEGRGSRVYFTKVFATVRKIIDVVCLIQICYWLP